MQRAKLASKLRTRLHSVHGLFIKLIDMGWLCISSLLVLARVSLCSSEFAGRSLDPSRKLREGVFSQL